MAYGDLIRYFIIFVHSRIRASTSRSASKKCGTFIYWFIDRRFCIDADEASLANQWPTSARTIFILFSHCLSLTPVRLIGRTPLHYRNLAFSLNDLVSVKLTNVPKYDDFFFRLYCPVRFASRFYEICTLIKLASWIQLHTLLDIIAIPRALLFFHHNHQRKRQSHWRRASYHFDSIHCVREEFFRNTWEQDRGQRPRNSSKPTW